MSYQSWKSPPWPLQGHHPVSSLGRGAKHFTLKKNNLAYSLPVHSDQELETLSLQSRPVL